MQNNRQNIDDLFKQKMQNYQVTPPAGVWDRIASTMAQNKARKRVLWLWFSGSAAAVIFAFVFGWHFSQLSTNNNNQMAYSAPMHTALTDSHNTARILVKTNKSTANIAMANKWLTMPEINDTNNYAKDEKTHTQQLAVISSRQHHLYVKPLPVSLDMQKGEFLSKNDQKIIAQNMLAINQNSEKTQSEWSIGVKASPMFRADNNQSLIRASADYFAYNDFNALLTTYTPNISGGIAFEYATQSNLALVSGVYYNQITQTSPNVSVAFAGHNWVSSQRDFQNTLVYSTSSYESKNMDEPEIVEPPVSEEVFVQTNTGISSINMKPGVQLASVGTYNKAQPDVAQNYQYTQDAGYVEIPVLLRYTFFSSVIDMHLTGGLNTNILVLNNVQLGNQNTVIGTGKIEGLRNVTFSSSVGLGLDYSIFKNLKINLEPTLKMHFSSLSKNYAQSTHPYALGIYSGLIYSF